MSGVDIAAAATVVADTVANGKVPSAAPTDMFSTVRGTGYPRPAGMTSHSDGVATDNDRAAVAGTVATVGSGVGGGAVAAVGTVATVGTVIDGTVADTGTVKKQNFHTGLDPVSRTNNSAQPTEFNAVATTADNVRFAQSSSLDTGSSPVWSAVAGADATDDDRAVVAVTVDTDDNRAIDTVTNPDDATIATDAAENKIVIPAGRRNPDARTAIQIGAGSGTADVGGDGDGKPAAGGVADGTVGATRDAVTFTAAATADSATTPTTERLHQIILKPVISEKTTTAADQRRQIAFAVLPDANKREIKRAVEMLFEVKVAGVQVANMRGKVKRFGKTPGKRNNWKKAYVRLAEGHDIDFVGLAGA